ncbi:MAG TPA: sterol desaturase family protein [Thermoanaerobaculia bacterium]|nr:sterol desaturase family protein [Thermoanaerobaculia bacterium]
MGAAALFVLLERLVPFDRGQPFLREGFWTDLVFYSLLQNYVLALLIGRLIAWIDAGTGLSRLHLLSSWPVFWQVVFFVVTHDLYIYAFHRWQHRSPFLWRLHEAHHSVQQVDWLAGARSHAFEILINQTVEFAPMLLLGAAPQVPILKGLVSAIWGMYIHANIGVRSGRLQLLLNGPEAHRWHHSTDLRPPGMNFATKLALWDVLFGTFYLPKDRKPSGYGLTYVDFPRGYWRQSFFAFRSRSRPRASGPPPEAV